MPINGSSRSAFEINARPYSEALSQAPLKPGVCLHLPCRRGGSLGRRSDVAMGAEGVGATRNQTCHRVACEGDANSGRTAQGAETRIRSGPAGERRSPLPKSRRRGAGQERVASPKARLKPSARSVRSLPRVTGRRPGRSAHASHPFPAEGRRPLSTAPAATRWSPAVPADRATPRSGPGWARSSGSRSGRSS